MYLCLLATRQRVLLGDRTAKVRCILWSTLAKQPSGWKCQSAAARWWPLPCVGFQMMTMTIMSGCSDELDRLRKSKIDRTRAQQVAPSLLHKGQRAEFCRLDRPLVIYRIHSPSFAHAYVLVQPLGLTSSTSTPRLKATRPTCRHA